MVRIGRAGADEPMSRRDRHVVAALVVAVVDVQGQLGAHEVVPVDQLDVVLEDVPRPRALGEDDADGDQPARIDVAHHLTGGVDRLRVQALAPEPRPVVQLLGGVDPVGDDAGAEEAVEQPGEDVPAQRQRDAARAGGAQLLGPALVDVAGQERHPAAEAHLRHVDRRGGQPGQGDPQVEAGGPGAVVEQRGRAAGQEPADVRHGNLRDRSHAVDVPQGRSPACPLIPAPEQSLDSARPRPGRVWGAPPSA